MNIMKRRIIKQKVDSGAIFIYDPRDFELHQHPSISEDDIIGNFWTNPKGLNGFYFQLNPKGIRHPKNITDKQLEELYQEDGKALKRAFDEPDTWNE
jgi:hypothetical protein